MEEEKITAPIYKNNHISRSTQKEAKKSNIYLSPEEKQHIVRKRIFFLILCLCLIVIAGIVYQVLGLTGIIQ